MRGKVVQCTRFAFAVRITPAYAGKSVPVDPRRLLSGDHPRLCGEKVAASQKQACESGSPPPMRGKAPSKAKEAASGRITPAYAGKRSDRIILPIFPEDHPRLCGEKSFVTSETPRIIGSPPPMRGKGARVKALPLMIGITPAYAGKSIRRWYNRS